VPVPALQLLLTSDRMGRIPELFVIEQPLYAVFVRKSFDQFVLMFLDATFEIRGDPYIEHTASASEDVYVEFAFHADNGDAPRRWGAIPPLRS